MMLIDRVEVCDALGRLLDRAAELGFRRDEEDQTGSHVLVSPDGQLEMSLDFGGLSLTRRGTAEAICFVESDGHGTDTYRIPADGIAEVLAAVEERYAPAPLPGPR